MSLAWSCRRLYMSVGIPCVDPGSAGSSAIRNGVVGEFRISSARSGDIAYFDGVFSISRYLLTTWRFPCYCSMKENFDDNHRTGCRVLLNKQSDRRRLRITLEQGLNLGNLRRQCCQFRNRGGTIPQDLQSESILRYPRLI